MANLPSFPRGSSRDAARRCRSTRQNSLSKLVAFLPLFLLAPAVLTHHAALAASLFPSSLTPGTEAPPDPPLYQRELNYFLERFFLPPLNRKYIGVCAVCFDYANGEDAKADQCNAYGRTTSLLSIGGPANAIFVGDRRYTPRTGILLDGSFGNPSECFEPQFVNVRAAPTRNTRGEPVMGQFAAASVFDLGRGFVRDLPPTAVASVGFYVSVWDASGDATGVGVHASNEVTAAMRVDGLPDDVVDEDADSTVAASTDGSAVKKAYGLAPANSYNPIYGNVSLVESFLSSPIATQGKWASAILYYDSKDKQTIDVAYLIYNLSPCTAAGASRQANVYAYAASFADSVTRRRPGSQARRRLLAKTKGLSSSPVDTAFFSASSLRCTMDLRGGCNPGAASNACRVSCASTTTAASRST